MMILEGPATGAIALPMKHPLRGFVRRVDYEIFYAMAE